MIFVLPVYANSLCVSKSTHSGALPGPAYPYVDYHRSTEVHTVKLLPGPWSVTATKVRGDSQEIVLSGHDTGMMIPHLSPIMDNIMLPVTLVSSSCAWPFASLKKVATVDGKDKGLVGFLPAIAPYLYCDNPEDDTKKDDTKKDDAEAAQGGSKTAPPVKKVNSDALQKAKAGDHAGKQWLGARRQPLSAALNPFRGNAKVASVQQRLEAGRGKLKKVSTQIGIPQVNGCGRVYIPPGKTIMLQFNFGEFAMGWAKVLVSKGFDSLAGMLSKRIRPSAATDALQRLDPDVALTVASKSLPVKKLGVALGKDALWKLGFDGMFKSAILDMKFKAPYGLFSYSFAGRKGTFFWSYSFEYTTPIDMKGARGWMTTAMSGLYQPAVENLTKDNPNYAAGPDDEDDRTDPSQPPGSAEKEPETAPSQSTGSAEKDYWTDPSQPSEGTETSPSQPSKHAEKDYWTDPSQPSEQAEPDYWTDPSGLGDS